MRTEQGSRAVSINILQWSVRQVGGTFRQENKNICPSIVWPVVVLYSRQIGHYTPETLLYWCQFQHQALSELLVRSACGCYVPKPVLDYLLNHSLLSFFQADPVHHRHLCVSECCYCYVWYFQSFHRGGGRRSTGCVWEVGRNATPATQTHEGGCSEVKVEGANSQLKAQKNHLLLDQSLEGPGTEERSPASGPPIAWDSLHWCFGISVL